MPQIVCPKGHFCKRGSQTPMRCPPLYSCPPRHRGPDRQLRGRHPLCLTLPAPLGALAPVSVVSIISASGHASRHHGRLGGPVADANLLSGLLLYLIRPPQESWWSSCRCQSAFWPSFVSDQAREGRSPNTACSQGMLSCASGICLPCKKGPLGHDEWGRCSQCFYVALA